MGMKRTMIKTMQAALSRCMLAPCSEDLSVGRGFMVRPWSEPAATYTRMNAWSPDWNHWFKLVVATMQKSAPWSAESQKNAVWRWHTGVAAIVVCPVVGHGGADVRVRHCRGASSGISRQRGVKVDQQGVCVSTDGCRLRVRRATVGSDNEPGERVQMKEWGSVGKARTKWASRSDI